MSGNKLVDDIRKVSDDLVASDLPTIDVSHLSCTLSDNGAEDTRITDLADGLYVWDETSSYSSTPFVGIFQAYDQKYLSSVPGCPRRGRTLVC